MITFCYIYNMIIRTKNKIFFSFVISLMFLTTVLLGPSYTLGMDMREDGTMGGCLFTMGTEAKICPMTTLEHISSWQELFTATFSQSEMLASLILLLFAFAVVVIFKRTRLLSFGHHITFWRLYIKHSPHLSFFSPLREAFSRGILHPKIY